MTTPEVPEFIYFGNPNSPNPSRVYHTRNCNGNLDEDTKIPATVESVDLIQRLGFVVCKTCKLRYEKEQLAITHAAFIEDYGVAAQTYPEEFELRVYWHRGVGNPVQIWSSKGGMR